MGTAITEVKAAQEALRALFSTHSRVVFFGGAGVSTASGIPDFRSVDGLYRQHFAYPPEEMLSHGFCFLPSGASYRRAKKKARAFSGSRQ